MRMDYNCCEVYLTPLSLHRRQTKECKNSDNVLFNSWFAIFQNSFSYDRCPFIVIRVISIRKSGSASRNREHITMHGFNL